MTTVTSASLPHVVRCRLPKVQKTTSWSCDVVPIYCRKEVMAENRYIRMIPASIILSGEIPLSLESV
ncbi:MAG: hypothetical protein A4E42_00953 [Methanoregulaceae archaeon PtaU1.Bin222]|nr:MAG: hypothetical protein A4E42_00953 [Methanoregulaceae archaeon PtaU1.Bin222]